MSSLNARGQVTALECLRNFYISANTLPQYIVERQFTGIRTTAGSRVTYLTSPVTNTVSGFFVTLRGNNGATVTVDSRNTTPSFAAATPLIAWISACNSSNTNIGGVTAIEEITYGGDMPVYIPSSTTARHFVTEQGQEWYFSAFIWFFSGTLRQASPPAFQTIISGITYNYGDALWYNTTTNEYNKYYPSCSCWKVIPNIDGIASDTGTVKTTTAQNIWGVKNFKNKVIASEGLTSNGIESKGSSTKPAYSITGIKSSKDTIISTNNFVINASYEEWGIDCSGGSKTIFLPANATSVDWVAVIFKSDATTNTLTIKDSGNNDIYVTQSRMTITFKNSNEQWKKVSASFSNK